MPASDLFFSFNDNHVGVSVRHLGIVRLLTMLTPEQGRRCTSYIKVMAGMDLAEQRRPLDGRWVRGDDGVGAGRRSTSASARSRPCMARTWRSAC